MLGVCLGGLCWRTIVIVCLALVLLVAERFRDLALRCCTCFVEVGFVGGWF